jgi:hypothetical protein
VFPPGLIAFGVVAEVWGIETELLGNERALRSGWVFALLHDNWRIS